MTSSSFNKKKWLKNHLARTLELKSQGLTYQSIIEHLKTTENMPFDLTESLLSRYLKEFASDESSTLKTETALKNKIERQKERLERQNNEIQNLSRRLERVLERNNALMYENEDFKERNHLLENKFLDGEGRIKDLKRYNGFNNVHWKIADLTQKNDDLFQSVLMLERLSERLAKPHEEADEKIKELTQAKALLESDLKLVQDKNSVLQQEKIVDRKEIQKIQAQINHLNREKSALSRQLETAIAPVIHQDQEKIEELTRERQKFLQERNQLHMLSKRLKSDLSNTRHQCDSTISDLQSIQYSVKQRDLWRLLAIVFGCSTFLFIFMYLYL